LNQYQEVTIIDKKWINNEWVYVIETTHGTILHDVKRSRLSNILTSSNPTANQNSPTVQSMDTADYSNSPEHFASNLQYDAFADAYNSSKHPYTHSTPTQQYHHQNRHHNHSPSPHQNSRPTTPTISKPLSIYEYIQPEHPGVIVRINVGWLSDKGKKISVKCEDKNDIKQYYTTLRSRLAPLGMPLKSWHEIQPNASLCALHPQTCVNYKNVIQQISLAIYNFLDDNKNEHFENFLLPHGYIDAYSHSSDGLMVLYQIVQLSHQRLIDPINGDEEPTKPTFTGTTNIFQFTRKLKEYYDVMYPGQQGTPDHNRKVLKYVRDQLNNCSNPDLYKKARDYITSELECVYNNNGGKKTIPERLTLEGNLGVTLMQQYSQDEQTKILSASKQSDTSFTINKVRDNNRFKRQHNGTSKFNSSMSNTTKTHIDKICEACGLPGHCITINGCDAVARHQKMIAYYKKTGTSDKKHVTNSIEKFDERQAINLQKRRKFAETRNTMRKEIKTMIVDDNIHQPETIAEIKQAYLDEYRTHYEEDGEDDIFDNLSIMESIDGEHSSVQYAEHNSMDESTDHE
jgi:hypothetical protein